MNREYSSNIIKKLLSWGVEEFYICAGKQNIPLIEAVCNIQSEYPIVFNHFEERAAAFYALGRIKSLKKPVAVITTSGTAVGELLPATMEGYYSGLPLVLITADRPKSYRGTGAPQSAEQKNIFGVYVSKNFDLDVNEEFDLEEIAKNKPLHINVCFNMPVQSGKLQEITKKNLDKALPPEITWNKIARSSTEMQEDILNNNIKKLKLFIQNNKKTLIIVSQIFEEDTSFIVKFIKNLNCLVYIESISNFRECEPLNHLKIRYADKIWENAKKIGYEFDSVIKIGGTPTHRIWRDLDETHKHIKVLSISELPFPGMPNAEHITINLNSFFSKIKLPPCDSLGSLSNQENHNSFIQRFIELDTLSYKKIVHLFTNYPEAEQSIYFHLSNLIKPKSRVYLGTSLPIRYWDVAATFENKNFYTNASRGLNGIDGVISTFLGFADEFCSENWGIFGDLTTLYDIASPWVLQYRPNLKVNIVVVNNGGGRIFNKVLSGDISLVCQNVHKMNFEPFAKLWNLSYEKVSNINQIKNSNESRIIEIVPNNKQTELFNEDYMKI